MLCTVSGSALLFAPASANAVPATSDVVALAKDETRLYPEDLFSLSAGGDPQIAPDGGLIVYTRTANDIMTDRGRTTLWFIDTRTGEQSPLDGVGPNADSSQPRWSPDGTRLAFVGTPEGGRAGIYMFWKATGRTALIASPPRGPGNLTWSPDGSSIAFTMLSVTDPETLGAPLKKPEGAKWSEPLRIVSRIEYKRDGEGDRKPGYYHVFVIPADGGIPRQLTTGSFEDSGPLSWTSDNRAILFTARRGPDWERERDLSAIYRVSLADGALTRMTENKGPDTSASVSPNGKLIAFTGYTQKYRGYENRLLYVMDIDGRNVRPLTGALDRSVEKSKLIWAADGQSIYFSFDDHGVAKVARADLAGRIDTLVSGLGGEGDIPDTPYTGGGFSVAQNGVIAFTQGAGDRPSDIAITRGGKVTRLTRLNDNVLGHKKMGAVTPLAVTSSFDQASVDAWLVTPPDFDPSRRYPMVLEIHGGPFGSYGPTFASDYQLYAAAGYVVLYVNPRGSTSYGDVFANGITHSYPGTDYDDLMSAVDGAIAKGFVDPERLFVAGVSGGGALTAWIVGKNNRFKAAVSQAPVIEWTSEVLTVDFYPWMGRQWFGKQPWEDHELYWKHSPLSLVGNVTTPTMLIVGDQDHRTDPSQAEQFYGALQIRGVPTTLIKIPGASHGTFSTRPSQSAARVNAILAWFARFDMAKTVK
nr:S9 family peptidase [Sphingobium boeckii]